MRTELTRFEDETLDGVPFELVICAEEDVRGARSPDCLALYCVRFGEARAAAGLTVPAAWVPLALAGAQEVREAFVVLSEAICHSLASQTLDEALRSRAIKKPPRS